MKITLISPYSEITSFGLRTVSSSLKRDGHSVRMIFLPDPESEEGAGAGEFYQYPQEIVEQTVEICKGSDLVGITLMTYYFDRVVQLSRRLKEVIGVPVMWGGVHATIKPEESLDVADIICVGEGEDAVVELCRRMEEGKDYLDTRNFWFRRGGKVYSNDARPLIQNLDNIPYPDYDLKNHYVWNRETMTVDRMDSGMLQKHLSLTAFCVNTGLLPYQTMATRGCLFNCSYCCNSAFRKLYRGQSYVRRRSVPNFVGELEFMLKEFPFIKVIDICDDSFFDGDEDEIEEFRHAYKARIPVPFRCLASPLTISDKKMDDLVKAGLFMIQMGIETGSKKTKLLYKRNIPNDKIINAAKIINKYKDVMTPPLYDIIVDNPYEDMEDSIDTMKMLLEIPRPYNLQIFSLVFYYGTALYDKAKADGMVGDEAEHIYRKQFFRYRTNYLNFIMALLKKQFPLSLIRVLLAPGLVRTLNKSYFEALFGLSFRGYHILKRIYQTVLTL